ncbi:transposase [Streptomyces sp. Ncost-T6T-1]|uniref:IS701 family transposase n=1 Tax=Streptomyces sp. Ncost-T6T-1 TaxID=1100828 RepID=UPI001EFB4FD0|nr:transposase [Streptomyces sp. Ncost-T6T-1]
MSLADFSATIFSSLRRADQRRWAHTYLHGLLITPGKKSVRRLAANTSCDPSVAQALRQFVSLSPWDFDAVMNELTHWVESHGSPPVWNIGRAVLPKRGDRSVGVDRHFSLDTGRTVNCQLGMGAFLSVGAVQFPVDWSLYLSPSWVEDPGRRNDARIPDSEQYRPLWALALRLVDRLTARTPSPYRVVVADMSDEPDVRHLLGGLAKRRRDFVVAVPPHLPVLPVGNLAATPPPISARARLSAQNTETAVVTPPAGRQRVARFQTSLVHAPGLSQGHPLGPPYRLFSEVRGPSVTGPLWITSLAHQGLPEVASIAAAHSGTADAVASLERDFGLLDFEGRSFPGWHHHMALVSAAYAYRHLKASVAASRADERCGAAGQTP